jgi:flagellin
MAELFTQLQTDLTPPGDFLAASLDAVLGLVGAAQYNTNNTILSRLSAYTPALSYNVSDGDTGAIGGANANGVSSRDTTATGVMPDIEGYVVNPTNFNTVFSSTISTPILTQRYSTSKGQLHYEFQFGPNEGDNLRVNLEQLSVGSLGINNLNLVSRAQEAISLIDDAIDKISSSRARFGAQMNVLEHSISNLETNYTSLSQSRSAIEDTDYATEVAGFTKSQLLNSTASSMLAQANSNNTLVLNLLSSADLTRPINPGG